MKFRSEKLKSTSKKCVKLKKSAENSAEVEKTCNLSSNMKQLYIVKKKKKANRYFAGGLSPFKSFKATFYPKSSTRTWYNGPLFFDPQIVQEKKRERKIGTEERKISGKKRKSDTPPSDKRPLKKLKLDNTFVPQKDNYVKRPFINLEGMMNIFSIEIKQCRNKGGEWSEVFPSNLCRDPYKYLIRISKNFSSGAWSGRIMEKIGEISFVLLEKKQGRIRSEHDVKLVTKVKSESLGEKVMIISITGSQRLVENYYQLQLSRNNKVIFSSGWFKIHSRKNDAEKKFWAAVAENKREANRIAILRKKLEESKSMSTNTLGMKITPPIPPLVGRTMGLTNFNPAMKLFPLLPLPPIMGRTYPPVPPLGGRLTNSTSLSSSSSSKPGGLSSFHGYLDSNNSMSNPFSSLGPILGPIGTTSISSDDSRNYVLKKKKIKKKKKNSSSSKRRKRRKKKSPPRKQILEFRRPEKIRLLGNQDIPKLIEIRATNNNNNFNNNNRNVKLEQQHQRKILPPPPPPQNDLMSILKNRMMQGNFQQQQQQQIGPRPKLDELMEKQVSVKYHGAGRYGDMIDEDEDEVEEHARRLVNLSKGKKQE